MEQVDCVVVGAGVVGLAVARALALAGREVLILEQHAGIGSESSARSSEVIHAGIYYPTGSLKARLCVEGRQRLYAYLNERSLPHRRCGKLLVATAADQLPALARLQAQALANGVDDLQALDAAAARALEPALHCVSALWSPSTGIVDTHALMLSYLGDAENAGATLALHSPLERAAVRPDGIVLHIGGADPMTLQARSVVNAAGLHAQALALRFDGLPPASVPPRFLAKGSYFTLAGRSPFSHLIYPMPDAAGLGVHLTLDLGGQARFGPDVEWVDEIDYRVDPRRGDSFYAAVRAYWPGLADGALQPGYAGIRPKAVGPGNPAADFLIHDPAQHGVPGLVNLFAIESPGITASMAIADRVAAGLARRDP